MAPVKPGARSLDGLTASDRGRITDPFLARTWYSAQINDPANISSGAPMPEDISNTLSEMKLEEDDRRLLIVDDDEPFRKRLARAMEKRGFEVSTVATVAEGVELARRDQPPYAVFDLRLADGSGLDIVGELRDARPDARIIVLTGYGNIATAVAAVKAGAIDYLPKPSDADAVAAALLDHEDALPPPPENPMSADRVKWEHIQRVFEQCGRNVSETARRLRMHRRTLQRILNKHAPRG
jgi:two-component system response regulator RegA